MSSQAELISEHSIKTSHDSVHATRQGLAGAVVVLLMVSIIAAALLLRAYSLPSQGFMQWDEGLHALEGQFLVDTWQRMAGLVSDPGLPPGGRPPTFVRQFH